MAVFVKFYRNLGRVQQLTGRLVPVSFFNGRRQPMLDRLEQNGSAFGRPYTT